ncbi:MAG: hypothetical protein GYA36_23035 [Veillonellaceae bacterium]|nr:hypothetical protein [Veillonellaceae bacterium]
MALCKDCKWFMRPSKGYGAGCTCLEAGARIDHVWGNVIRTTCYANAGFDCPHFAQREQPKPPPPAHEVNVLDGDQLRQEEPAGWRPFAKHRK